MIGDESPTTTEGVLCEALASLTQVAKALTYVTEQTTRLHVELEEAREGLAELDARLGALERDAYQANVRRLREER